MSRILLVILAWIAPMLLLAQGDRYRMDQLRSRYDNVVAIGGTLDYNANSVHNELPIALWKGAYLDRELRERSRADLRERNSIGYILEARATWWGKANENKWRTLVSVAHHEQMGTHFTRDLFALTFFGNAGYEGQRADLGPSGARSIRYQTIGIGQHHVKSGSYWRWDIVAGQNYDDVDVSWAGLYTGTDGRLLRASILGDHYRSDTSSNTFGAVHGLGVAVSGRWETQLGRNHEDVRFSMEAQDLGLVNWFGQALLKDTVIEYTGIGVDNILELDNVITGEDQLLDTFGLRYDNITFTRPLPFFLKAAVCARLGDGWIGTVALDQRYLPGYVPQLTFTGERMVVAGTEASASLCFGGFGGLRFGMALRQAVGERIHLQLSSPHLPGFFSGSAKSAGVMFGATVGF